MKRDRYYPSRIADQAMWLTNYAENIGACLTAVGMGAEVSATVADARWLLYVLGAWLTEVRAFNKAATEAVEIALSGPAGGSPYAMPEFGAPAPPTAPPPAVVPVLAGALNRIFKIVQQFKESNGYTTALGEQLMVIGAEDNTDHPTPKFSLALGQGAGCQCVDISFTKFTHQGVYIESKRGTGAWEFAAIDTEKPYTDDRPLLNPAQPEVREYRLRFWDKGTPNGPWSEVQKITVAP
jgi:hypothetical protein